MMLDANYPPPVAALLTIGTSLDPKPEAFDGPMPSFEEMRAEVEATQNRKRAPEPYRSNDWPDYLSFGLGPEHVPALLAMVVDESLDASDRESGEYWAPVHAWRALGQLRAEEAIAPFIALLDEWPDADYFHEEVPEIFGMIGPVALPALTTFLNEETHDMFARSTAARSIEMIGRMHPALRDTAVAAISAPLATYAQNDRTFNALLLSPLLDLEAVETMPLIRDMYAADAVDHSFMGDLEDVEIAFGVRTERETPRPRYNPLARLLEEPFDPLWDQVVNADLKAARRSPDKKAKNKKKMAEKSRRQNRKKK
jgi:hypothetical protein